MKKKSKKRKRTKRNLLGLRNKLAREILNDMLQQAYNLYIQCQDDLAEKFGAKARKFAKYYGIRIPRHWKYFYCRKCKSFIFPGKTARVRIRTTREPHIVIYCIKCGGITRIPYKKAKNNVALS